MPKHRTMTVSRSVIRRLQEQFSGTGLEQGCLIGSSSRADRIDRVIPVPGHEDAYRFQPDMDAVNRQIRSWAKEGICFRGLIHSHPDGVPIPSDRDLEAMGVWTRAAGLSFLLFGVAAVSTGSWELGLWHSCCLPDGAVQILPMVPIPTKRPRAGMKWRFPNEKTTA